MTVLCINGNWILSEQQKNLPCPVFGTEYNVTGYADVTNEQDVYGNWVCNGRYYHLEGFKKGFSFHSGNFAILPDESAEEMEEENFEAIVNLETQIA